MTAVHGWGVVRRLSTVLFVFVAWSMFKWFAHIAHNTRDSGQTEASHICRPLGLVGATQIDQEARYENGLQPFEMDLKLINPTREFG